MSTVMFRRVERMEEVKCSKKQEAGPAVVFISANAATALNARSPVCLPDWPTRVGDDYRLMSPSFVYKSTQA